MRRLLAPTLLGLFALAACSDEGPIRPQEEVSLKGIPTARAMKMGDNSGSMPSFALVPVGSNVHQITGASSAPCSINTGIAFDGENLIMSCWYHTTLDFLDPQDGSLVKTLTLGGSYSGLHALAWDASQSKLWVCANHNKALLVDTSDGSYTEVFTVAGYCTDGLAYDGTDNTLYTSGDVSSTLYHYQSDGTLIGTLNMGGKLGGYGNSGIATGGDKLYLANNGGSQVYEASKDLSSSTLFASFARRIEDLECDDITFAPDHAVVWQQDAYDRIINAWAIPAGACPFGGGAGALTVEIDIKPNSDPNAVNVDQKGNIPVAIQTTESFDAADVDPATVTLGNNDGTDTPVAKRKNGTLMASMEDWDGDGDDDMVLHFDTPSLVSNGDLSSTTTELFITGKTSGGTSFIGSDAVKITPSS